MNTQAIRLLFDYQAWAFARVWQGVDKLPEERFTYEIDFSLRSMRNHLVHVADVDNRWVHMAAGLPRPQKFQPEAYPTREAVATLWRDVYGRVDELLAEMAPNQPMADVTYPTYDVGEQTDPAWRLLLTCITHGTDHRAQMMYTLHKLGAPTQPQDLIYYLREEMPERGGATVSADVIRDLYRYHYAEIFKLVQDGLGHLSDEQLDYDFGYSFPSVREQLGHLVFAEGHWLRRITKQPVDETNFSAAFEASRQYINALTDEVAAQPVEYKTSSGAPYANNTWEILIHLANHAVDHRAQTLAYLHELGEPTWDQDLIVYYWNHK